MSKTTEKQEVTIANLLNDVLVYYVNYLDAKDSEELKTGYENARTHIIAEFTALQARCQDAEKENREIKNDISDYEFIVEQVSKVYMHITGDKLSKPNYYADVVIAVADDEITAGWEEYLKEETEELNQ